MQSEDTITVKFVDILESLRNAWKIEPQNTQTFLDNRRKPDFTVKEKGRSPIVAEVKIDGANRPDISGENQAKRHLGRRLASYEIVTVAMAVRFPYRFRDIPNRDLTNEIRRAKDLHYVLLDVKDDVLQGIRRFPNEGWIQGGVTDIATALRIGAMPNSRVENAAFDLEYGVDEAAKLLEDAIEERPEIGQQIEDILHQKSCLQTSRMAMLIITNAFVFQSTLARKPSLEEVPALGQLRAMNQRLNAMYILEAWDRIYQVNYRPIFDVATKLVNALASDEELVGRVLWGLRATAQKVINRGLAQVHELAGIVFQRLIVDRKFIKTYYTRPESVALLSALVLPERDFVNEDPESTRTFLSECKVADYACGTGALLNGVYQRLLGLYEQAGGNGKAIHKYMMENNLIGCDIMPNASHLTAALITSNFPNVRIGNTRIHVMEYGTRRTDGRWALGTLDLIEDPQATLPLDLINTQQVEGGASPVAASQSEFQYGEMDIVVDNPPFTRSGSDSNASAPEVPNTIFGERDVDIAAEMKQALREMDSIGNSRAGLGSYFVDLADKMLKEDGVMGFVLPLTALTSPLWQGIRNLWARSYYNHVIVTIADANIENCAFSADTHMAECLVVAIKSRKKNTGRGTFVCLYSRPESHLEALEIAKSVQRLINVKKLEDPPIGGDLIKIGDEVVGSALDCDLRYPWGATRVQELSLIQSAYHLAKGHLWLPNMEGYEEIPITTVGKIATIGFSHGVIKGAFDIEDGYSDTDDYPALWHIKSKEPRSLMVRPDSHGTIRSGKWNSAQRILKTKSRVHHSSGLQFNANSLAVFFTKRPALGVRSVANVVFNNPLWDYAWSLWGNSSLGLLCHWIHSSKQQEGRGMIELTSLRTMPTLDVRRLDETALQNAKRIFEEMKYKGMLPFNQMHEDKVRWELDRLLLSEVLGFTEDTHPKVHEGVRILRERLSAEPSIHGDKQSRVVL